MVNNKNSSGLNDTGQRTEFETGALRETVEGKGRFDLIPFQGLMRTAQHYENGSKKYADRNWEKGLSISRCLDSAARHLAKYADGWDDEDHLAAVVWNCYAIMFYDAEAPEMQDLPKWQDRRSQFIIEPPTDSLSE